MPLAALTLPSFMPHHEIHCQLSLQGVRLSACPGDVLCKVAFLIRKGGKKTSILH